MLRGVFSPSRSTFSVPQSSYPSFNSAACSAPIRQFSSTLLSLSKKRMPPKKQVVAEKPRLGKVSNNLKIGICGMPNVGKSSFFNCLAKADLGKAANFPYATIDPEETRVPVPDERFTWLCQLYKPKNEVPAFLTCIDIAGLTAGASTGAGLGNAFLSHVRAVDGIYQVVRAFSDAEVIHVEGDVDPVRDMGIISNELRLKDIEWCEKQIEAQKKTVRSAGNNSLEDRKKKEDLASMEKVLHCLSVENKDVRKGDWTAKDVSQMFLSCHGVPAIVPESSDEQESRDSRFSNPARRGPSSHHMRKKIDVINAMMLLTAKPVIYLVNLSETDYERKKNKWLPKIKEWIDTNNPGDPLIPISVPLEERLMAEGGMKNTTASLAKVINAGYTSLKLCRYFTAGEPEVRAWTFQDGIKAPAAAGIIHSDFEKSFVCGMKFTFDDLKELGTEAAVQAAGKITQIGKTYTMQDGDLVTWKCGA